MLGGPWEEGTQRSYARLAGVLFLGLFLNALGSSLIGSQIAGSGTFAETAQRIAVSERLYRVALCLEVIETLGGVLLVFALYATLKRVNSLLSQLALIFGLEDSVLGWVVRLCGFVKLYAYTSSSQALVDLTRRIAGAAENLGGICFGIALLLFFYMFFRSRYLPRLLSALGLSASVIWIGLYFANLVFPELRAVFRYICWPPMAVANIATGFWLLLFAVKSQAQGDQSASG